MANVGDARGSGNGLGRDAAAARGAGRSFMLAERLLQPMPFFPRELHFESYTRSRALHTRAMQMHPCLPPFCGRRILIEDCDPV